MPPRRLRAVRSSGDATPSSRQSFSSPRRLRLLAAALALSSVTAAHAQSVGRGLRSAPSAGTATAVTIENAPTIDLTRTDGGLLPVAGAENFEVFRASRARPELAEGKGWTYNHHPDLAVWHGRYYVAWDSGEKDEDTWPARELYSTSENGSDWSAPQELFPEGISTPTRLYFFHAPNGRMLAFAGLRVDHEKTDEDTKGPIVVREITAQHTLGPVFTLRAPATGRREAEPALFNSASDAAFVEACSELLAARVTLETQDLGVFLDPRQRMKWHNAAAWPNGKVGNGFWKAPSFYHRADGALVGIGKSGWTTVSTDGGVTWSQPVVPPTLKTNNAKVWGQRTGDGRFALVYNPTARPRYPLAIVSGDDGVTFGDMRVVQSRFTAQRYPGINKNPGLQYIRGIAEWASDGSIAEAKAALWLVYSSNKEDIWVSRVPLPIDAPARTACWNVYQPKWAQVVAKDDAAVSLQSREPFDCAEAMRLFAPAAEVSVSMNVTMPAAGFGAVDLELLGGAGGARPVRVRLCGDGFVRAYDRDKLVEYGHYAPGAKLAVRIDAHGARGVFTVSINGKAEKPAQFTERTPTLQRFAVRAWASTDGDRPPEFLPASALVSPAFDQPTAAPVATELTDLSITAKP